jgi:hypothetical protein
MTNIYHSIIAAWFFDHTENYSLSIQNNNVIPDLYYDFDLNICSITNIDVDLEIVVDNIAQKEKEIECCVCMENITEHCLLSCQHMFCLSCIKKTFVIKKECPLCRKNINKIFVTTQENKKKLMETHHS